MSRKATALHIDTGDGQVSGLGWNGRGQPIVALHGLFDSSTGWAEIAAGTSRPFYALDIPGFISSDPVEGEDINDYAQRMAAAISSLKLKKYTLIGHSFGGAIASEIAAQQPGGIEELLLVAPAGYGSLHLARLFDLPGISTITSILASRAAAVPPLAGFTYTHFVAGGHRPEGDLTRRLRLLGPDIKRSLHQAIHALARSGNHFEENFWSGPVRCVWGEHDHLIPRSHMEKLQELLPQTEMHIWEDTAHHPQAERPDRFLELIQSPVRSTILKKKQK